MKVMGNNMVVDPDGSPEPTKNEVEGTPTPYSDAKVMEVERFPHYTKASGGKTDITSPCRKNSNSFLELEGQTDAEHLVLSHHLILNVISYPKH